MPLFNYDTINIKAIASAVPGNILQVDSFVERFGIEQVAKSKSETGVRSVCRSKLEQTASDLGFVAASEILNVHKIERSKIGFVIFVSKTPDYRGPATATVLHKRLELSQDCIAFDINIGNAGFIYAMQVGCSMLGNLNREYGFLVIGDTTSKQLSENDPLNMYFGDGASAVMLERGSGEKCIRIRTGSDGEKFRLFHIPGGGFRNNSSDDNTSELNLDQDTLTIDEYDYLRYGNSEMPKVLLEFISGCKTVWQDYDFFALPPMFYEQIDGVNVNNLPGINEFIAVLSRFGDTCGNLIPMVLAESLANFKKKEIRILAAAYGEGLTWGLIDFSLSPENILNTIVTDDFFKDGEVSHDF